MLTGDDEYFGGRWYRVWVVSYLAVAVMIVFALRAAASFLHVADKMTMHIFLHGLGGWRLGISC